MKIWLKILIILLVGFLISCGSSTSSVKATKQTYVVKSEPIHKTLFFTGTIQPLRESTISIPMDAVIEKMNYHYGERIKKNEIVLTLNSSELQKQYNDTLTDYLKAKDNFTVTSAKFIGTTNLWDAGLLSKNNFLSEKSSLDTARVTLMQATRKLTEMLEKMDDQDGVNLSNLNIAEFDKVRAALTGNHNVIHLKAPATGVLLYPPKSNEDKTGRLSVGSTVKSGQVFALVGDLSGVSVEIDVPEIDIDKIYTGMKANITGIALGKEPLQGELVAVNAQASLGNGNALPSFNALVEVKKLTDEQRSWIKVGMSASIGLIVEGKNELLIPIAAIKQQYGSSIVNVQTPDGKITARTVTTGPAQADKVVINSGLKEGEMVVYDE